MTHAAAATRTLRFPRRRPHGPAASGRAPGHIGSEAASTSGHVKGHGTAGWHGALSTPPPGRRRARRSARAADIQLRIADTITAFAGSMPFVYIHAIAFVCWMLFVESEPWPKLTLIVSLEAIFLSTFVMIGQNRQAEFQRAKADHDFTTQEQELRRNTELTRAIHTLTTDLHRHVLGTWVAEDDAADE